MPDEFENMGVHKGTRYGILGGTFDPPHLGHLVLAQEACVQMGLDRVWFVPTREPPHKPGHAITSADARVAMVELAIGDDPQFALSRVDVDRPGPSYTAEMLALLRAAWGPDVVIALILGWDMLLTLPTWHAASDVLARSDVLAAAHRPGVPSDEETFAAVEEALPGVRAKLRLLSGPQVDLSATILRERVMRGLPIRYLVPDHVREYITRHALYRDH